MFRYKSRGILSTRYALLVTELVSLPLSHYDNRHVPKTCAKCKESLPVKDFYKNSRGSQGRHPYCKPCHKESSVMNTSIKKYGITKEEYVELRMVKHCEVCGSDGEGKTLHIDHCHASGKVRGMLCHSCNVSLGKLKESVETLQNLIKYIQKHGQTEVSGDAATG